MEKNQLTEHLYDECRLGKEFLDQLAFNEKMAELGRLSAGVIHELNTPLSVIVSAAQMILREEQLPDFVVEMVARINEEAQRLSQMTRGIMSFARREEGSPEQTDINQLVREVAGLLRYEIQKRSVFLVEEPDYRIPLLVLEKNRLKQVLINLITNALQAMEGGGGILTLKTLLFGDQVQIEVRDTGPGIPADLLTVIFTPFFTTKPSDEGTGLGLFVTRNIIQSMKGTIDVSSREGEGAVFTIRLPVQP